MVEEVEEGALEVLRDYGRAAGGGQRLAQHFGEHGEGDLHRIREEEVPDFGPELVRNALGYAYLRADYGVDVVFDDAALLVLLLDPQVNRVLPVGVVHVVELVLHRGLELVEDALPLLALLRLLPFNHHFAPGPTPGVQHDLEVVNVVALLELEQVLEHRASLRLVQLLESFKLLPQKASGSSPTLQLLGLGGRHDVARVVDRLGLALDLFVLTPRQVQLRVFLVQFDEVNASGRGTLGGDVDDPRALLLLQPRPRLRAVLLLLHPRRRRHG